MEQQSIDTPTGKRQGGMGNSGRGGESMLAWPNMAGHRSSGGGRWFKYKPGLGRTMTLGPFIPCVDRHREVDYQTRHAAGAPTFTRALPASAPANRRYGHLHTRVGTFAPRCVRTHICSQPPASMRFTSTRLSLCTTPNIPR